MTDSLRRFGFSLPANLIGLYVFMCFASGPGWAAWQPGGNPVCVATNAQQYPAMVSDGFGGVIVVWTDRRSGEYDIYAQRMTGEGEPLWMENGQPVCTAFGVQRVPSVVSDGAGGAIIVWKDERGGDFDVYAQRTDGAGNALWADNGIAVCTEAANQQDTEIVTDGSGGAVIVWRDFRSGGVPRLYAQKVNAAGELQWAPSGVLLCPVNNQYPAALAPDGLGGAFLAWFDYRNGVHFDLYAQRIASDGSAVWTPNGVPVCTAAGNQMYPELVSDETGGVLIAWYDWRTGGYDIYMQRLLADGSRAPGWWVDGLPLCTAPNDQFEPVIAADGSGGGIVTWYDNRSTVGVYAQRVSGSGNLDAAWPANGLRLNTSPATRPAIVSDGSGGAIVAWHGTPGNTNLDVVAQRVTSGGGIGAGWPEEGLFVCTEPGDQSRPVAVALGSGDAIVVWSDARRDVGDIYAHRIGASFSNLNAVLAPPNFGFPAVPRNLSDATWDNATITPVLDGNVGTTLFNWTVHEEGSLGLPAWEARLFLDGAPVGTMTLPAGSLPGVYGVLNHGPFTVSGGRHTVTVHADPDNRITESAEGDNVWAGQFVWSPLGLTRGEPALRLAPPQAGNMPEPNSDGFQFTPAAGAAWVSGIVSFDGNDDYDLWLYDDYSGSLGGFSNEIAISSDGPGETDFVVGGASTAARSFYPAAVRENAPAGQVYFVDQMDALDRRGDEGREQWRAQIMDPQRFVDVYEGDFAGGQVYYITAAAFRGSSDLAFRIFPPDPGGIYAKEQAIAASINLTSDGQAVDVLTFVAPQSGRYPIVVYRKTGDGISEPVAYHFFWDVIVTGVGEGSMAEAQLGFAVSPNPMAVATRLSFRMPQPAPVRLFLFDVHGRLVKRLAEGPFEKGTFSLEWDGRNEEGMRIHPGVYFALLSVEGRGVMRQLTVVK